MAYHNFTEKEVRQAVLKKALPLLLIKEILTGEVRIL